MSTPDTHFHASSSLPQSGPSTDLVLLNWKLMIHSNIKHVIAILIVMKVEHLDTSTDPSNWKSEPMNKVSSFGVRIKYCLHRVKSSHTFSQTYLLSESRCSWQKKDISSATYLGPYDNYSVLAAEKQNLGNPITHRFAIPSPCALWLPASSLQHSHCTSGRELRIVYGWMPTHSQSSPILIAEAPVL